MSLKIIKQISIRYDQTIKFALNKLKISGYRCLLVLNKNGQLIGTCTDGDIRKKILNGYKLNNKIIDVYNKKPSFLVEKKYTAHNLKKKFKKKGIDILPILNKDNQPVDIILRSNLKRIIEKKIKNKKKLSVIIMAGGLGARLKPFTNILPKALIPVNGKPIIDLIIDNLENNGLKKIFISINKKDKILRSYFSNNKNKNIKFIEENKPLGPLGSISKIKNKNKNDWLILNCDTYFNFDLEKMIKEHSKNKSQCTVVISKQNEKSNYGHCILDNNKKLLNIEEKPKKQFYLNIGIYLISSNLFHLVPKKQFFSILNFIKILKLKNIPINSFLISKNSWFDTGNWVDYRKNKNKII